MSDKTAIEWTDATWNPITGCSVVSPGCTNCYAMRLAGTRLRDHATRTGLTRATKAGPVWTGDVRFNERALAEPLRWRRPRMIFVCAHGDLFHENVPDEWIDRVFAVMALCPQHVFQVLTKRPARMRAYVSVWFERLATRDVPVAHPTGPESFGRLVDWSVLPSILPNVWLGVSAEDQPRLESRWPDLAATPAAVRWISAEPLLGPLDFMLRGEGMGDWDALRGREYWAGASAYADSINALKAHHPKVDWIVVGGESGPHARPMHPHWARAIRDQCEAAGVPFFFKQWGEFCGEDQPPASYWQSAGSFRDHPVDHGFHFGNHGGQDPAVMRRVGKKAAGRLLDGREHGAMPAIVTGRAA